MQGHRFIQYPSTIRISNPRMHARTHTSMHACTHTCRQTDLQPTCTHKHQHAQVASVKSFVVKRNQWVSERMWLVFDHYYCLYGHLSAMIIFVTVVQPLYPMCVCVWVRVRIFLCDCCRERHVNDCALCARAKSVCDVMRVFLETPLLHRPVRAL